MAVVQQQALIKRHIVHCHCVPCFQFANLALCGLSTVKIYFIPPVMVRNIMN